MPQKQESLPVPAASEPDPKNLIRGPQQNNKGLLDRFHPADYNGDSYGTPKKETNVKTKKCKCCKRTKSVDQFQSNDRQPDGYHTMCKDCMTEKQQAGLQKKREKEERQAQLPFIESAPIEALFDQEIETLQKQVREWRDKKKRFKAGKMKVKLENGKVVLY